MERRTIRTALWPALAVFTMVPALTSCGKTEPPPPADTPKTVKLLTIEPGGVDLGRSFPGVVAAASSVDLAFRVSGPLIELPVSEGQHLAKDDLVARIDPRDFQTRLDNVESALAEAQAQYVAMKSGARPEDIRVLEAKLEAARASLLEADTQYDRLVRLLKEDVGTQANVDAQKKARDVAESAVRAAEQELQAGRSGARQEDIQAMESRIAGLEAQKKQSEDALKDTSLYAPFDGVVALRYVENRQNVQANQPIVGFQDVSSLEIAIDVPESAMAQVPGVATIRDLAESMDVKASFAAIPGESFPVDLKKYETQANPVTQTFKITFSLAPPEGRGIRPGMNAVISGKRRTGANAASLFIPVNAVFADADGNSQVWYVDADTMRVSKRNVSVGTIGQDQIEILDGLSVGDTIAVSAVNSLREGMEVRPFDVAAL